MTQEAAQKCLEAASPETEVRRTFLLPCNLGDSGPKGQRLMFMQSFFVIIIVVIIVNNIITKLTFIECLVYDRH